MHSRPPSPPTVHCGVPVPAVVLHVFPHTPQFSTPVGSTHDPLQSSDVGAVHPSPHFPFVHVGVPAPESGPSHAFMHDPQCSGFVGSTHVPLQSSVVGAGHPASPSIGAPSVGCVPVSVSPVSPIGAESPVCIDESVPGPPSPSPSTLASPPPPHVLVSLHVPNVSVPHPTAHTAALPASPTHNPNVTA